MSLKESLEREREEIYEEYDEIEDELESGVLSTDRLQELQEKESYLEDRLSAINRQLRFL
jgi:hypothetical protein